MLASPLTAAQWTPTPLTAGQAPLSPHSFWQDFLTPQEMEDTDSVPTGPYDNHLHYQHNQDTATTVTVNGTESFTPPARELSFSTHNQFMTPSRSITENSQDPRERDALAVLTTISTQHIAPLTKLEGQTGFGHDQEKAFAETHDSLSALAAITAQHPSHIHKDLCDPLKAMSAIAVDSSVAPRSGKGGKGRACGRGDGKPGGSSDVDVSSTMSRPCDVCGEPASGHYFGALVCLPCKSFFIRCTKGGEPAFSSECGGKCDVQKTSRIRCQYCRFQRCVSAGMFRKEKPEAVVPEDGQVLCKVCSDLANGVHFGVTTCEGCKKFFRRGLKEHQAYVCKGSRMCTINPRMRNSCRFCRYQKCLRVGMSREAIKMGRPKKGDQICVRSFMPTQAMMGDRKPPFPDNDSTALGGGPEFDNSASEKQGGVGHAFGALEQRFTVEPVCDASYLSDEFLEAVSMDLGGHQESGMKNRIAAVSSESLAMEENQLVPTASFSGPCGSPMESAVSPGTTTSSSASSFDVCSSSSQSPVPGDAQHLPPKPSAAVPGHVEPFPNFLRSNQHDSFNPDQQQQQQQGPEYQKVGEWMKNNTSPRQTDCTECCQLSPLFACTPRSEPLVSSPCCCNPCMCTSPLADCSSPACPADYRSQLSLLSSLCQSQQDLDPSTMAQHEQNFLLSPRPLTTMAGHHVFSQPRSEMPSPSKVCSKAYVHASEPLATWHSFSPPVSAVTPQQRYVLKRQGQFAQQGREPFEKNMSHYSRKATYGNTAPVQVSTASSKADTAPRSKPVLEKESNVFADDLYELLETLDDKPSLQGKAVLAARFDPTNTHDVAGLGQDRLAMPNNSVDSFCSQCDTAYASTNHTTQESRRRQSDSVLQCPSSVKMRMLEPRYYCTGKQVREVGSTSDLPSESPYSSSQLLARYQADGVSTQRLVSSVSFSSLESLASIDPSRIVLSQDHGHRPYRDLSVRTSATPGFPTFSFPFVYPASRSLQDGRPHGASYKPVTVKQEKTNVVTSLPAHFGVQRIDGSGSAQEAAYQTNGVGTSKGSCELPCYDNIDDHDNRSQGRNIYSIASSLRSLADVITQRNEDKTAARDRKDEDKTAARDRKDEDKTAARDRKDELVANFKNSPDGSVGVSNKGTVLHADVHTADNGGISPKPLAAPHAERSNLNTYSNSRTPTLLCHSPSPKSSVRQNGTFTGCFPQRRTPDGYSPKSRRSGPYTVQSPKDPQNEETRLLSPESSGQSSHATKGSRQGSPFTSCPRQNSTFTAQSPGPRVHARHEQDTDSMMLSAVPYSGRTQTNLTNDRQTLKSINRYFLSLENSCDKNNCDDVHGSSHHHHFNAQPASDVCQSDQCRVCNMDSHSSRSRDVNTFAICTRRFHCYWHGHNPSPFALHMTAHNQHLLASVAAALCHFSDRLSQLHRGGSDETSPSNADQVRDTSQVLLERLYQQSTAIASITKDFLLQIPEGSKLSAEDVSSLSQQCGFGSALILLGSQAFDAECQRFRELWSWTVAPTSPLFCFKVQLLALAGKLNAIGMDKMETALLCALSLISTDLSGLKDRDAIREVRASLLDALEAYISSRDQWFKVRVKRLFSVLPDVRVMSAWYCAIVSHIRLAAVKST